MKYEYITSTGKVVIEVDEQYHDLLVAMDREEYNSDRKHSRRYPISLENAEYEGEWFDDGTDLIGDLITNESYANLRSALAELTQEQQSLVDQIYFEDKKIIEIARADGVSEAAVRNRLKKIYDRLKNILD